MTLKSRNIIKTFIRNKFTDWKASFLFFECPEWTTWEVH